jgi:hypothetical protein
MAAARVGDELAGLPGTGCGEPGNEVLQRVVGDSEHHELGAPNHLVRRQDGCAGQQFGRPGERGLAHRRDGDDAVPDPRERRPEDGSHPAGADDADIEACWTLVGRSHAPKPIPRREHQHRPIGQLPPTRRP